MAFILNGDISIFYTTEGDPSNPPLFLSHWFMGSHETWFDTGWVRELKEDFYLIIIDHRGYGNSSKPHDPSSYALVNHVSDIIVVLDKLQLNSVHFMGYSMGGRIGYAMMAYQPSRLRSAIIGGMHPYASDHIPTNLDERIELLKQGMQTTLTKYGIGPRVVFDRMLQNDPQALLADTIHTKEWKGLDAHIKSIDLPVLLFVGMTDGFYSGMKQISSELHDATFVAFPNEDHRTAYLKRQLLVPHLHRFLKY